MIGEVNTKLESINKIFYPEVKLEDKILQKVDKLGQSIIDHMRPLLMFGSFKGNVKSSISEGSSEVIKIFIERMNGLILAKAKKDVVVNQWLTDLKSTINRKHVLDAYALDSLLKFVASEGEGNIEKIVIRKQKLL